MRKLSDALYILRHLMIKEWIEFKTQQTMNSNKTDGKAASVDTSAAGS